jgi:hypothetical protein
MSGGRPADFGLDDALCCVLSSVVDRLKGGNGDILPDAPEPAGGFATIALAFAWIKEGETKELRAPHVPCAPWPVAASVSSVCIPTREMRIVDYA